VSTDVRRSVVETLTELSSSRDYRDRADALLRRKDTIGVTAVAQAVRSCEASNSSSDHLLRRGAARPHSMLTKTNPVLHPASTDPG
jgi:hypothetical protein